MDLDSADDGPDPATPAEPRSFSQQLDRLVVQCNILLRIARGSGDGRLALAAIREARGILDAQVRLREIDANDPTRAPGDHIKFYIYLPAKFVGDDPPAGMEDISHEDWRRLCRIAEAYATPGQDGYDDAGRTLPDPETANDQDNAGVGDADC
jgi:hypothetical protein